MLNRFAQTKPLRPSGILPCQTWFATMLVLLLATGSSALAADFPQGLILHFSFDQWESGGIISDKSGHNNEGHVFGARWTALGKQAGGYDFTTTNNYIQVHPSPSLNATQATVAVLFKTMKSDALNRYIIEKCPKNGFALYIAGESNGNNKGKLCFRVNGHECLSDTAVTDNAWHHAAATFDGEALRIYLDSKLQQQVTPWKGEISVNTNSLALGVNLSTPTPAEKGQSFEGTLDEAMIFNHALTEAEVKLVIASTKPKFTQEQVNRRLAELKELRDRGLILQDFYDRKVKECEVTP